MQTAWGCTLLNSFRGLTASSALQPVTKARNHEQTLQCSPPLLPSVHSSAFPIHMPPIVLSLLAADHCLVVSKHHWTNATVCFPCLTVYCFCQHVLWHHWSCWLISGLAFSPVAFWPRQFLKWGPLRGIVPCKGDIVFLG